MKHSVRFITLGCRVNQYETQAMREALEGVGIQDVSSKLNGVMGQDVDFVVVNTCTVTQSADRENLYWIRRAKRESPKAKLIVAGCFAERNRSQLESIPEVDLVLGNYEKEDIATFVSEGCAADGVQNSETLRKKRLRFPSLKISRSENRSRAYIKIQDGCNHACSFCKVVMVRGRSRSRKLVDICDEAMRLRDAGHKEIVLTGIQLGAYGCDLQDQPTLSRVIEACAKVQGIKRIRLSSIEPTDVSQELIATLRDIPKCCPHLHIPLQSGDDGILRKMNRRYTRNFYAALIQQLKSEISDFQLSLDVMAGFPGETEENFKNTMDLLEEVKPIKAHVFPYSRRQGTKAAQYEDLPPDIVRQRANKLTEMAQKLADALRYNYIGREVSVLVEKGIGKNGLLRGTTNNFFKVFFPGTKNLIGQMVSLQLLSFNDGFFLGKQKI